MTYSEEAWRHSSFDLFCNPFVLLGIEPSATAEAVADAFEDALSEERTPQEQLSAAKHTILNPIRRLEAELGTLLDTPHREWRTILAALKSSQMSAELRRAFANLAPLSRSNLLSHVASRKPADQATLIAWIRANAEIDISVLQSLVAQHRQRAGLVSVNLPSLASALVVLREKQARALFEGFTSPGEAIDVVTSCTNEIIDNPVADHVQNLSRLLEAYHRHVDPELSLRRERLAKAAESARKAPENSENLATLIDALSSWNIVVLPLQLLEAHKERDDPTTQDVFQEMRGLAIDLANDFQHFEVATTIINACRDAFAELPRASEKLAEDSRALQEQISISKIEPLAKVISELGDDLRELVDDLRVGGFGATAARDSATL